MRYKKYKDSTWYKLTLVIPVRISIKPVKNTSNRTLLVSQVAQNSYFTTAKVTKQLVTTVKANKIIQFSIYNIRYLQIQKALSALAIYSIYLHKNLKMSLPATLYSYSLKICLNKSRDCSIAKWNSGNVRLEIARLFFWQILCCDSILTLKSDWSHFKIHFQAYNVDDLCDILEYLQLRQPV